MSYKEQLRKRIAEQELQRIEAERDVAELFLLYATRNCQWQQDCVRDTCLHKALYGERRGGKTSLMGISAIYTCLLTPYSKVLYCALTQDSCRKVMYDGVLSMLTREAAKGGIPIVWKLVGGDRVEFDNGSIIYLVGLDANKKEKDKVRGVKTSLNMLDEMQSFTQNTQLILQEVLGPTTADTKAPTILGGTSGNSLGKGYWWEITHDNTKANPIAYSSLHPEWKVWRCEWSKNTNIDEMTGNRICDNVAAYLAELQSRHPGIELTNSYRQEWNAEWVAEESVLIYRFTRANVITDPSCVEILPKNTPPHILPARIPHPDVGFLATAVYILGIDLGYNDPTSMTVVCYNLKYSNRLYVIECFNKGQMLVGEVAEKIQSLQRHYKFAHMVGDSSSLQVFETLNQDYHLFIEKADRAGKLSHQLVLNSDLQTRSVIFLPGTEELQDQLSKVQWERKALEEGRFVEDPKFKNDLSDSFLYAHNYSRAAWYTAPKVKYVPTTPEEFNKELCRELMGKNKPQALWSGINFATPGKKR